MDAALIIVKALKQFQQGCLATAVAADESQFPIGIELDAHIFKDRFIAFWIGKRKVVDPDH